MKRINWTDSMLYAEALKHKTRDAFQKANSAAYQAARRRGKKFFNKICSHMPKRKDMSGENNSRFKWTAFKLKREAKKYKRLSDFQHGSPSAYVTARNRGVLYEICSHMAPRDLSGSKNPNYRRTDDEIRSAALDYTSLVDFQKEDGALYQAAWARGLLKEICSHMKPSRGSSFVERKILESVRTFFPDAKKTKDCSVTIKRKPYIKRFEIDIFVPELNKGIEFDGAYWHSFEFMRNSANKNKWSNRDVQNYHDIKDSWFASKGIQILHIKEEDWKANKNKCVFQIEQFLGITGFMPDLERKAA